MSDSSTALFDALLHDLSDHLPQEVITILKCGGKVERWPDITPQQASCLGLATSFLKKFRDNIDVEATDKVALEKFKTVNQRSKDWSLELTSDWDEILYNEFKTLVYEFLSPEGYPLISSGDEIWARGDTGPGAAIGTSQEDFYNKMFSSELSCVNLGIYRSYRNYIAGHPEWSNAEIIRTLSKGSPRVVEGNRLRFVPKDRNTSRTICIEPVLNMYGQLGIGNLLRDRLKSFFGIDLSIQPERNRDLAREGSLMGTEATLDLESASDSISLKMLEAVLPRDFLAWLKLFRSPTAELPDGSRVDLHMVSTMGNGFTFPLQTMLFSCVVEASFRARGYSPRDRESCYVRPRSTSHVETWGVFGDDIIVPTNFHYLRGRKAAWFGLDIVRDCKRLLSILGFTVNASKSFEDPNDPFRESCGGDFFRGHPIRGVYIKSLRTMQDKFVALNRLNVWSAAQGIPLRSTVRRLLKQVKFLPVPPWEQDDSGVRVPWSMIRKMRHHTEYQSVIYRRLVPVRRSFTVLDRGHDKEEDDGIIYNMSGLLLAFLKGTIRSGRITRRASAHVPYRMDLGIAPNWHYPERFDTALTGLDQGQRWESAVRGNTHT